MREIKFRGKSVDGKWVIGSDFKTAVGLHYIIPQNLISAGLIQYSVDNETVGQYIGLLDKNRKEIFEGDITQDSDGMKYLIKWGINSNGFIATTNEIHGNVYSSYHLAQKTELIGNIYENPELINS